VNNISNIVSFIIIKLLEYKCKYIDHYMI